MSKFRVIAVAAFFIVIATCSSCTVPGPSPSDSPSPRSTADGLPPRPERSPTPAPTTSANPTATSFTSDGELLFTITATATNGDGASVALRQQVFAPVEFDDLPVDLQAQYAQVCTGLTIADYGYLRTVIEVTDTSPPGKSWPSIIGEPVFNYSYILASTGMATAYTGAWRGFQSACATVFVVPGTSVGTVGVLRTSHADELGGWARMQFGFHPYYDSYVAETSFTIPIVANCEIAFEAAAAPYTLARSETFPGAPPNCLFGSDEYFRG